MKPIDTPDPKHPSITDDLDDSEPWGEHTPIVDPLAAYRKIGQVGAMVSHLVKREIPALREDMKEAVDAARSACREASDAKTEATIARAVTEDMKHRVDGLEGAKLNGAATKIHVEEVQKKLEKNAASRKSLIGLIVSIVLALLGSSGGAIWWAAQVDTATQHEATTRAREDQRIQERVEALKEEKLSRIELAKIRAALEKAE